MLTWTFLLIWAALAQQRSIEYSKHDPLIASTHTPSPDRRNQAGRSPPEIPLLKHDVATVKFRNTDDDVTHQKFNALAPAHDVSAVRAPLAQSVGSSSGLSALPQARLLRDWEAEDLVLIVTVDGQIQARSRKNGEKALWILEPDSPMIQTTHHCHNRTDDDSTCDHEYIFVVEPTKDGSLYILYKDPHKGLQRLHTTVRELALDTPKYLDNPSLVSVATQKSTAYVIDAATGNILQQFSNDGDGFFDDDQEQKCRRVTGLELDETACDSKGIIKLGRIEYTVRISSASPRHNLCTIKYSEWVPNKADTDLQAQYITPLDSLHIQTSFNGKIMGLDHTETKVHRWQGKLDTPVARIFDVVRPVDSVDDNTDLALLSRPLDSHLLAPNEFWPSDQQRTDKVFLNQTDSGMWYVLSERSYPGVTAGAHQARFNWYDHPIDLENDLVDLVGVHMLMGSQNDPPVRLTIDGRAPSAIIQETEKALDPLPTNTTDAFPGNISVANIVLFAIMLGMTGAQYRNPILRKLQDLLRRAGLNNALAPKEVSASSVNAPESEHVADSRTESAPSSAAIPEAQATAVEPPDAPTDEGVEAVTATPSRSRTHSSTVGTESPQKEDRAGLDDENDSEVGSEDDRPGASNGTTEAPEVKKKAKRGKRGGKKNKKNKSMDPEALDTKALVVEVAGKDGTQQVGNLKIDLNPDRCLGHGSNGTSVYPGTLYGREVAVKRLLRSPNSLASKEIKHLLNSDENAHVIRFLGMEESHNFTYIALERFTTSLDQFIEKPIDFPELVKLPEGFDVKDCLTQITLGVSHLHNLKLVHRDLKPQNVLVKSVKTNRPTSGLPELLYVISDFGLAKAIEDGHGSTIAATTNHTAAGTTGWRAPELLVAHRDGITPINVNSVASRSTTHSADGSATVLDRPSGRRATKAIDIFSLGCVFFYVMTQGCHPFDVGGTSLGRDLNIKENRYSTAPLRFHNYEFEAEDLVMQMLNPEPALRPDTLAIRKHPYFWNDSKKLDFMCGVSDVYEGKKNSIKNIHDENAIRTESELKSLAELTALQSLTSNVIGDGRDFTKALPKTFFSEMGKQRKYTGTRMIDLLRALRNKWNHYEDLPADIKDMMTHLGEEKDGYYRFWAQKFPSLLVNCHCLILERGLMEEPKVRDFFREKIRL